MIEEALEQFVDSRLASGVDSYLASNMGTDYKNFRTYIFAINDRNKDLAQTISEKEARINRLEKQCAEFAATVNALSIRIQKFEKTGEAARSAETNVVLSKFNNWAANPFTLLPPAFIYLAGDFRIRSSQELIQTPEESKWITNREGAKKYLLPNPNSFNQMTNILELYEMDQGLLKEKGKNKIKIIIPCEISSSGFVEFPGKLQILP